MDLPQPTLMISLCIVIHGDSHLQHLHKVLVYLANAGLTAKPPKCFVDNTSCDFLGHTVGNGKVALQQAAITDFPHLTTKKQLTGALYHTLQTKQQL